jgi:HK97 family phage portal protein
LTGGIDLKKITLLDSLRFLTFKNSRADFIREWLSGEDQINTETGDINVTKETALKYSAVFSCIRVLAETFASIPIKEYKKQRNGDRIETNETGLYDILHNQANEEMSAFSFKEMAMYQLNTGGNLVCQRVVNRLGEIVQLYPYEWDRVEIYRDKDTRKLVYKVDRDDNKKYSRGEIFHVAGPSVNGIIGMSPVEFAASSIKLGLTYEKFSNNFYKNGALPSGVFEHPGMIKDTAFDRLKEDLKKNYQSLLNAGKPMLLEDGMKFNQLTMKLADAELLASKKFQIEDVCRIYRVPLHLVQNLDRATNNNIEHQSLEFVMYTMLPWCKRWEDCFNTQLLTKAQRDQGYYFEFNMSGLLRGDAKSMAEAFAIGRQWGWLSVNDIRKMLNLNSIENGDIYLQPMNMIEAGTVQENKLDSKILNEIETLLGERK